MQDNTTGFIAYIIYLIGVVAGWELSDWLTVFGIVSIVATYWTDLYFKRRRDKRDGIREDNQKLKAQIALLLQQQAERENEQRQKGNNGNRNGR